MIFDKIDTMWVELGQELNIYYYKTPDGKIHAKENGYRLVHEVFLYHDRFTNPILHSLFKPKAIHLGSYYDVESANEAMDNAEQILRFYGLTEKE